MAIDQETFNTRLYSLLKTRGYKPVPRNANNERTTPQDAEVFEFTFKKDDEDYGLAWVTIDQASNLKVYYNDDQSQSPKGATQGLAYDDSWSGFLRHLKQWAQSKQLSFELQDGDRPGDDMRQRETNKKKEKMAEGYHAVNQKTSYNDNIPNVKVVIQHDRAVQEGEQRWRNVHKIFVENQGGERFAVPTRMPGIARVYGRHVAEGGTPYDDRGKHITTIVEEYTKMAGFVRATRRGEFNESVALLIAEGVNHHKALRESLQRMQSHRGYNAYFESWTPPLMEDDSDSSSIAEMFAQETIDPRIESVLPILNRLNSGIINEIEEVNELDQWAKGITEITEEVVEEEKRDTHCSAKCCGADVKAEDCGCSPDCPHCNCNKKKLEENPLALGLARAAGVGVGQGVASTVMGNDDVNEGAMSEIHIDAQEMSKEEFSKKHPEFARHYDEINASVSDDELEDVIASPVQQELELDESYGDFSHVQDEFDKLISDLSKQYKDDPSAFKAALETEARRYKKTIQDSKNTVSGEKSHAIGMLDRLEDYLEQTSSGKEYRGSSDAMSAASADAKKTIDDEDRFRSDAKPSEKGVSAIGRAIAGMYGLAEEKLEEFQERDFDSDRWEDEPEKFNPKLVDKETGQEVKLPYETVDFRGDPMTVIGFTPPHKSSSSGRIEVEGGMTEYFPGVAGLKIIGHEFDDMNESTEDDDLRDEESGKNHDPETGKRTKPHPFNPDDDSIDEHRGPRNPRFSDKEIKMAYGIANDPRYKDGNMSGAIKAIESIKKGLSDHPSVEKVLQATQMEENKMEETKSGGQTFAGHFKTGKAGQWRNTGPTKGRPAKVGDLVGAEESFDPMSEPTKGEDKFENAMAAYDAHGEEGLAKALGMSIEEFDQELNEYGMEHGLHADDDRDTIIHGMVEQMIDDEHQMSDMRRLSGLEEAGKPTTSSKHSSERDLKKYDPTHGHTKPEGGNPDVCKDCNGAGCTQCDDGQVITPKRHDKKVDEAENSPDGNVGADDDGDNDKYNQQQTVNDRKSIQEADELLDIIKNIRI